MGDLTEADYWQRMAREARRDADALKRRCQTAEADLAKAVEVITPLIVIALDNLDDMDAETRCECERDIANARAALAELGEGEG